MRIGREQQAQIRSALQLLEPMGEVIEMLHKIILAHHPACIDDGECPVCLSFNEVLVPMLDRWADARAQAAEWAE